jgi:OOP family OmpA-OmpF porin
VVGGGQTPFQLIKPLRDQLTAAGYEIRLDCSADVCGGFDFRFNTLVLPAPGMFVDLTAYHFVSAQAPSGDAVSVLTSRDDWATYVQIVRVGTDLGLEAPQPAAPRQGGSQTKAGSSAPALSRTAPAVPIDGLIAQLEQTGHVVLTDLEFETGSSSLGAGPVASLDQIAAYLADQPERTILFVGHTDAVGSLSANQSLSRKRAQAAVDYLRQTHKTRKAQIGANGVGYLAPIASNLTPEGREINRRVEAVLVSTK